nr:hypothetical protein OG296_43545 [Streptomyces sp. NBC_01001]
MSYDRPTAAQSKRRISRSMMVFASAAFITGGIALPATAAITPQTQTQTSVTSLPSDGSNPHRQPGGGAYGPSTCKPGYVWREKFKGDTLCVTPAERQQAKSHGRVIDYGTRLIPVDE